MLHAMLVCKVNCFPAPVLLGIFINTNLPKENNLLKKAICSCAFVLSRFNKSLDYRNRNMLSTATPSTFNLHRTKIRRGATSTAPSSGQKWKSHPVSNLMDNINPSDMGFANQDNLTTEITQIKPHKKFYFWVLYCNLHGPAVAVGTTSVSASYCYVCVVASESCD